MKPRETILVAILLALAACGGEPGGNVAPETGTDGPAEGGPPLPDADINASLAPLGAPPPSLEEAEAPRFVGRWAAEPGLCATAAWTFTRDRLQTPAGAVCRFQEVREAPGGYDVAARCTAEGPERDDVLEIRFAESAGAMLFESGSIADAGLVRCED